MKMYYCLTCGCVFNFDEHGTFKHGWEKAWEQPCRVCSETGMLPVEDKQ